MAKELWVDKYRPKTASDYVFRDEKQKKQVEEWIKDKTLPNLLLSGKPGTGKSSLLQVLLNEIGVDRGDVKIINGSTDNGVDYIRDTVVGFASSMPMGDFKYILIEEFDHLSMNAQAALRYTTERFSNTCRFLFSCNYPDRIMPAIHSRCQGFHIDSLDRDEFIARMADILINEGIRFEEDTVESLDKYVTATFPDMRKCINLLQQNCVDGELLSPEKNEGTTQDYKLDAINLFQQRKYKEARELICSQIQSGDYEEFYKFMYQNLKFWSGGSDDKENECILAIRNGMVKHMSSVDPEINLSATLVELQLIAIS